MKNVIDTTTGQSNDTPTSAASATSARHGFNFDAFASLNQTLEPAFATVLDPCGTGTPSTRKDTLSPITTTCLPSRPNQLPIHAPQAPHSPQHRDRADEQQLPADTSERFTRHPHQRPPSESRHAPYDTPPKTRPACAPTTAKSQ